MSRKCPPHKWLIESPEDARAAGHDALHARCRCRATRTYALHAPEVYGGYMPIDVAHKLRDRALAAQG